MTFVAGPHLSGPRGTNEKRLGRDRGVVQINLESGKGYSPLSSFFSARGNNSFG